MDPTQRSRHLNVSGYGQPTHVDTSSSTQASLEDKPTYERKMHFTPKITWGEKFITGAKAFGLVAGAVSFGALALGLFPLSLIGLGIVVKGKSANDRRLMIAGLIIAFPVTIFVLCVGSLHKLRTGEDIFKAKDTVKPRQVRPVADLPKAKELAKKVSNGERFVNAFTKRVDALDSSQKQELYDYIKKLRPEPIFQEKKSAMLEYIEGKID